MKADLDGADKSRVEAERQLAKMKDEDMLFPHRISETQHHAVAAFKKFTFLAKNLALLQGYSIEMGQTEAIEVCATVDLSLNRDDL